MSVTVWGDAGGPRTIAEERVRWGALEMHAGAHSYDELSVELPDGGITVDADHDPAQPLGQLVYAELGDDDRLRCAVVVDDWLEPVLEEHETFFSPLLEMRGKGIDRSDTYVAREAELLGLSLTTRTKRIGAWPLRWRSGDVRSEVDRYSWPISWRGDAVLARAVDSFAGTPRSELRHRTAARIADLRPSEDETPWHGLREGDWVPLGHRSTLPNGLRVRPGRIISVR
jgi:hypothetical protein